MQKRKTILRKIREYRQFVEKENPVMYRAIKAYRDYIPILEGKLKE